MCRFIYNFMWNILIWFERIYCFCTFLWVEASLLLFKKHYVPPNPNVPETQQQAHPTQVDGGCMAVDLKWMAARAPYPMQSRFKITIVNRITTSKKWVWTSRNSTQTIFGKGSPWAGEIPNSRLVWLVLDLSRFLLENAWNSIYCWSNFLKCGKPNFINHPQNHISCVGA